MLSFSLQRLSKLASQTTAVVLAAGRGTRMKSELPKVLFPVLGRPMIHWVLDALERAGVSETVVVVGYKEDDVKAELAGRNNISFASQTEQLGTGHAVQMCRPQLEQGEGSVLVVAGDSPLIQSDSISELMADFASEDYACLLGTLLKDDPTGLGRIVRGEDGRFERIVEHKDASEAELEIQEVNMSTYLFARESLLWALDQLKNDNAQGEFYLTDCPELLRGRQTEKPMIVDAVPKLRACESLSINTVDELGLVEAEMLKLNYEAPE